MEIIQTDDQNLQIMMPEPTVSGTFGHSWEILKKNFPELLLVFLTQALLSVPMGLTSLFFDVDYSGTFTGSLFNIIYAVLVMMPVNYGTAWVYLKAARGETFRVQDMFFAYQSFGNVLVANILVGLIIGAGIVMLIVPGIIFACKLAFVPYLVMDEKMEATAAIKKSWNMTNGHAGTIFLMGITSFFVALCGLICFFVGIIPAAIWISLAFAAMYMAVSGRMKHEKSVS